MPHTAARMGTRERDPGRYQHHRPEQILLYQVVEEYCPAFTAHFVEQGRKLPGYWIEVHFLGDLVEQIHKRSFVIQR